MRKLALFGMMAGLGIVGGCNSRPVAVPPFGVTNDMQILSGQPGPGLVASQESPIPDVPMPIGFRPLPQLCSASIEGANGARRIRHVYQGMGSAGEAVGFYRQNLPTRGWQLSGIRGGEEADAVLSYTKGPEQLDVRVRGGGVSTLTIDIYPIGSAPTPAPTPGNRSAAGGA